MEINAKDTDVFQLLKQLKESEGPYPKELLVNRRQHYLKQVAEISAAAGVAATLKHTAQGAQGTGTGLSSSVSTLIETLLVIAIFAEAGAVTYFYRDKLAALYNNLTKSPKVEQVSNPPVISSPVADVAPTITPAFTLTVTETAVITPSQLAELPTAQESIQSAISTDTKTTQNTSQSTSSTDTSNTQEANQSGNPAISTPAPNGNNGNHYGQTPLPARTKEPGNNSNSNNTPDSQPRPNQKP